MRWWIGPTILTAVILSGCTKNRPQITVVSDQAHVLSPPPAPNDIGKGPRNRKPKPKTPTKAKTTIDPTALARTLAALSSQKNVDVVLRTFSARDVPKSSLTFHIDDLFENDPAWKPMQSSGIFGIKSRLRSAGLLSGAPDNAIGIYIFRDPDFLSIRLGPEETVRAVSSGLLGSRALLQAQELALQDPVAGLNILLQQLKNGLPDGGGQTLKARFQKWLFYPEAAEAINGALANNFAPYQKYLLKPVLYVQLQVRRFAAVSRAPLLGIVFIVIAFRGIVALIRRICKRHGWPKVGEVVFLLSGLIVLPTAGSLIVLSRSRLEDQWFVQSLLGVHWNVVHNLLAGPPLELVGKTGLLWGLAAAVLSLLKHFVDLAQVLDHDDAANALTEHITTEVPRYFFVRVAMFAYLPGPLTLAVAVSIFVALLANLWELLRDRMLARRTAARGYMAA